MSEKSCCAMAALIASSGAHAAEPGGTPVPPSVAALTGCWAGRGAVAGKPVTITIVARPIVQDAMLAVDAHSTAVADPADRYAAHLIFGGTTGVSGAGTDGIVGFWADSFGGTFTASGRGESRADGFDITYQYPDDAFVNRWRFSREHLEWRIVARDRHGHERPFADYALRKTVCAPKARR